MRIVFHPGPNKTGTTSIQRYLLKAFGSQTAQKVWYPSQHANSASPGHARLVQAFRRDMDEGAAMLEAWIAEAAAADTEILIVSAEDFCKFLSEDLGRVMDVMRPHPVHLIITQRNVRSLWPSAYQEQIKHGQTKDFDAPGTAERLQSNNRAIRKTIVSDIYHVVRPDSATIVIGDKTAPPGALIGDFLTAAGLPPLQESDVEPLSVNRSHGLIELEVIRHLNMAMKSLEKKGVEAELPLIRRKLVHTMMQDHWRKTFPRLPLVVPESWEPIIAESAAAIFNDIKDLEAKGLIAVIGDPEHIRA